MRPASGVTSTSPEGKDCCSWMMTEAAFGRAHCSARSTADMATFAPPLHDSGARDWRHGAQNDQHPRSLAVHGKRPLRDRRKTAATRTSTDADQGNRGRRATEEALAVARGRTECTRFPG